MAKILLYSIAAQNIDLLLLYTPTHTHTDTHIENGPICHSGTGHRELQAPHRWIIKKIHKVLTIHIVHNM